MKRYRILLKKVDFIFGNTIKSGFQSGNGGNNMQVTLQNLVNRMNTNEEFLKKHPENKEMLERKIAETRELIIQCVLQNNGNSLLERIALK